MNNIIISIFFIIIIIVLLFVSNKSKLQDTKLDTLSNIYTLLYYISVLFNKHHIDYTMIGGTLLGCIRDNNIIKWDDDGDLLVFNIEKQDLLNILNELTDVINIEINFKGLITIKLKDLTKDGSVDIFIANKEAVENKENKETVEDENKNNYIYNFQFPYNFIYSKEYFNHSEVFPLKNYVFGPIILKGPNNPYPYLFRTYDNWKDNVIKWNSTSYFSENTPEL